MGQEQKYWTVIKILIASTPMQKKGSSKHNLFQGMPGTFDMSGNMAAAGAPGGIQQQQMITPGQQQQAFARQQQQQLLGTKKSFHLSVFDGFTGRINKVKSNDLSAQSVMAAVFSQF